MKISLKNVQTGFTPIPQGSYTCVLKNVEQKKSKSQNDYLKFEYEVNEEPFIGRKLWVNRSLQPQALWALKADLVTLGARPDDLESDDVEIEDIIADLKGAEVILDVDVQPYQDTFTNQVLKVRELNQY